MRRTLAFLSLATLLWSGSVHAQSAPGMPRAPGLPRPEPEMEEVEWEEGHPPTPGHHLVKHTRPALIAGGVTLLVLGIASGVIAAVLFGEGSSVCKDSPGACVGGGVGMAVAGAGLGIVGGMMVNAGITPKLYMVTDTTGRLGPLRVLPMISMAPPGAFALSTGETATARSLPARGATFGVVGTF